MPKKRLQSPSSINTYKQCPRKYYYKYITELPTKTTFPLVRGKIAHAVLEDFFDIDITEITMQNFERALKKKMQDLFIAHWQLSQQLFTEFNLNPDQQKFYFSETLLMLFNWLDQFIAKIKKSDCQSFGEIFKKLTPIREEEYHSNDLYVHGFIDAIEQEDKQILIMDYKTSTNLDINEEQRLQLAIYALLYKETHGIPPHKVGIHFLRYKPKFLSVDEELLDEARKGIALVHEKTRSDNITDYPLKPGPLCKWCDFYKICFEQKTITEYQADNH